MDSKQIQADTAQAKSRYIGLANSTEQLLSFFDETADDLYAYVLHRTRVPEQAEEVTLKVYYTLLKRGKMMWWKDIIGMPFIIRLADKAIDSIHQWEEEASGSAYLKEACLSVPRSHDPQTMTRMKDLVSALKSLPLRQQKVAVFSLFLRWSAAKTAEVTRRDEKWVHNESEALERILEQKLKDSESLPGPALQEFLSSIRRPSLSDRQKAKMRMALSDKSNGLEAATLKYLMPAASFMVVFSTFMGCILVMAAYLVPPLSAQSSLKQIAAVDVVRLHSDLEVQRELEDLERNLVGLASFHGKKEIATISFNLAPHAVQKQVEQSKKLKRILESIGVEAPKAVALFIEHALAAD